MANRRKRKNQYLLDVKVHREGRARARFRVVGGVLALVSVVGLTGYGLYRGGCWAADRLIFHNPRYTIRQIVVQNDGALEPQVIAQFAGAKVGDNLLALDIGSAQNNLQMIPLIRRAEVRRVLPDRLVIKVEERMPVARLEVASPALRGAEFLIDRSGTVLKPMKVGEGTQLQPEARANLPVLSGISLADVQVGRKVTSPQIYRALELLDEFNQSAAASMIDLAQVDLTHPRLLIARGRDGAMFQFESGDFVQQLRRLGVIIQWAQQRRKQVQTADLTVARSVPVTFTN